MYNSNNKGVTYTMSWIPGQPDNVSHKEHFRHYWKTLEGFNDVPNDRANLAIKYVCEKDL